jgi:hypothetical protein
LKGKKERQEDDKGIGPHKPSRAKNVVQEKVTLIHQHYLYPIAGKISLPPAGSG